MAGTYYESYEVLSAAYQADSSNPNGERFQQSVQTVPAQHLGLLAARYAGGVTGICYEGEPESDEDVNALKVSEFVALLVAPDEGEKLAVSPLGHAIFHAFAERVQKQWETSNGQ